MAPQIRDHKGFTVEAVLREGRGSRPHVYRVASAHTQAVLKDFDGCDKWFAFAFGRLLASRESAALAAAAQVDGVPEFLSTVGSRALLMSYIDAEPAVKVHAQRHTSDADAPATDIDWVVFVTKLETLVQRLHRAGVAHGDLRSPMNTLVTSAGEPVVVDFTAALLRRGRWFPGRQWAFAKLCEVDRSAVVKMALRVHPESVPTEQIAHYRRRGLLNRAARRTGQSIRWLSRLLTRS